MNSLQSIGCALTHLGFKRIEQRVQTMKFVELWEKNGVSAVTSSTGRVRLETLCDVRVVRCANQPPMAVRDLISAAMRSMNGDK